MIQFLWILALTKELMSGACARVDRSLSLSQLSSANTHKHTHTIYHEIVIIQQRAERLLLLFFLSFARVDQQGDIVISLFRSQKKEKKRAKENHGP